MTGTPHTKWGRKSIYGGGEGEAEINWRNWNLPGKSKGRNVKG